MMVIDTAAIAHRMRRWLFQTLGTPRTMGRCTECGKALTTNEIVYYGTTCERCEGLAFAAFHEEEDGRTACERGEPKGCWNVRCQLGGRCCRAAGSTAVDGVGTPDGGQR